MTRDLEVSPLGELLRNYRHHTNLSIRALANRTRVHHSTLARIENGDTAAPGPDVLAQLATALEIPLADLFTLAGYTTPDDLPSFATYLRCRYRLSETAITDLQRYFEDLTRDDINE